MILASAQWRKLRRGRTCPQPTRYGRKISVSNCLMMFGLSSTNGNPPPWLRATRILSAPSAIRFPEDGTVCESSRAATRFIRQSLLPEVCEAVSGQPWGFFSHDIRQCYPQHAEPRRGVFCLDHGISLEGEQFARALRRWLPGHVDLTQNEPQSSRKTSSTPLSSMQKPLPSSPSGENDLPLPRILGALIGLELISYCN